MARLYAVLSFCALLLLTGTPHKAWAEEGGTVYHALAMHGTPKYAADFKHLDYVNPDAPKGGTLKLAKTGSFDTLNANIIMGTAAEGLSLIADQLMQRVWDEPFTLYGLVAASAEVPDDRSWVIYRLRPEAKFHDGTPMTAQDVKFSYEMFLKHGHPVRRRVYGLVKDVTILDPQTIKFTFGDGYDPETVMILSLMHVLPKHYWEQNDITKTTLTPPLGSGPYKIARVDPGRAISYERVADYWAKDLPVNRGQYNFDLMTYSYFRDDSVALQSFKAGEYDLRREYDITKWKVAYDGNAKNQGLFDMAEIPHGRPEWLKAFVFNTRRKPLDDPRVREALSYLFNYEWINRTFYFEALNKIESAFPNSELAARGTADGEELAALVPFRDHLPDAVFGAAYKAPTGSMRDRQRKALRLFKEAGYIYQDQKLVDEKGQQLQFEILLGTPSEEKIAIEFARTLRRIGMAANVRTVDSAQFAGRLESFDYDIVSYRWINSLSPGNEQMNYWGSAAAAMNGSRNYAGVNSPAVDAIADSIARAATREGLVARTRALDRVLMEGHYMIPLFYLGRDLVAVYQGIARPEKNPVYGVVLETFWKETPTYQKP
jgi:ABC-type oligopeptide transport system substrate-binding subunit